MDRALSHLYVIPGLALGQTLYPSGMPGWIGLPELLILLVVVLIFFGPKRLPEMGRSLGRGMREFKESVTGNDRDDEPAALPTSTRHAGRARDAGAAARARPHDLETDEAAAPSPRARRRGDARRASRRAAQPHLRGGRRARARARLHVRVPPPAHPLAEQAAAGGQAPPDHVRCRRAVPDLADRLALRGDRDHAADPPLAALGVPRAGVRRADAARRALARRVRHRADDLRDPLRLLRRAAGVAQIPDELRREPLQHPDPGEGLLLLRLARHARGRESSSRCRSSSSGSSASAS